MRKPLIISAGFAVLRDAEKADQRDTNTWTKISPQEARQIRKDLNEALAYIRTDSSTG